MPDDWPDHVVTEAFGNHFAYEARMIVCGGTESRLYRSTNHDMVTTWGVGPASEPKAMTFQSVSVKTYEPGGVDRSSFPLTMGLPFSQGELAADEPLAVLDESSRAVPLQTRVMETHEDGSVRWLLLDFQADLEALRHNNHTLVAGRQSPEALDGQSIQISERNDKSVIENGVLKLEIDRGSCVPLERVWHKDELVSDGGLEFLITADDGKLFAARHDCDVKFEIEESGPMRTLMRWEGRHKDEAGKGHFDFLVRMTMYAGQPFVRVDHTFINRLDPAATSVKKIVARLPVSLGGDLRHSVASSRTQVQPLETKGPGRIEQYQLIPHQIRNGNGEVLEEVRVGSRGWVDVSTACHGVMMAGKNFWQNYPKAIATGDDAIEYAMIPDRGDPFEVACGMAKTHTMYLCFHDGRAETLPLRDLAFTIQRWPVPVAPSQFYLDSDEVWDLFPCEPKKYPRLEGAMREFMQRDDPDHIVPDIVEGRAYGLKHYGDFLIGGDRWDREPDSPKTMYLNNEYDTAHACAMMFLHGGEVSNFYVGEAHALHAMDVDTCWHATKTHHEYPGIEDLTLMIGSQYCHSFQHTNRVGAHSHTFAEGMVDYYHLTGDRRFLDVAEGYARQLAYMTNTYNDFKWGTGRSTGWSLLVMGSVYHARPHDDIRRAVQTMVDKVFSEHDADGNYMGGTRSKITTKATTDRALNLCMRGLIRWHQATGDQKLRDLMVKSMYGYVHNGFSEEGLPLAGNWPEKRKQTSPGQGFANLETLAYAYRLTEDRLFVEIGLGRLVEAIKWMLNATPDPGAGFHRMLRGPFPFLAVAHELGILEKIPEAGRWLTD